MLPGIIATDTTCERVASRLGVGRFLQLEIPRALDVGALLSALRDRLSVRGQPTLLDVGEFEDSRAAVAGLAAALGAALFGEPFSGTAAELVVSRASAFDIPYCCSLVVREAGQDSESLLKIVRDTCEATRDLPGYLSFLLVTKGGTEPCGRSEYLRWQPPFVSVEPIDLMTPAELERRAAERYLSLRLYWEAAGIPSVAETLASAVDHGLAEQRSPHLDSILDRLMTGAMRSFEGSSDMAGLFYDCLSDAERRGILATGVWPRAWGSFAPALSQGVTWIPPGSGQARLTSLGFHLIRFDRRSSALRLAEHDWTHTSNRVRSNNAVSAWVTELAASLERIVFEECARMLDLDGQISRSGIGPDLKRKLDELSPSLIYGSQVSMLDVASFSELIRLRATALPASRLRQLRAARDVRNLAAHLNQPSWLGIKTLVNTLEPLLATI